MPRTVILAIVLLCEMTAVSATAGEFKILAVEEPPSSYRNAAGHPEGLAVDILRAMQKRMDNHDPIDIVPEVRALDIASRSPNVVLLGFSRIPEREQHFYWILPYLRKPWILYARKGAAPAVPTLADARGLRAIGVVRKDVRALYLKQLGFTNLAPVANHAQNVKKALAGRIPVFAYDPVGLGYVCQRLAIAADAFQPVLVLKTSEVYIMMSRHGTRSEDVAAWANAARLIQQDGTLQQIAAQWVGRIVRQTGIACAAVDGIVFVRP